jgi:hypothetical protein
MLTAIYGHQACGKSLLLTLLDSHPELYVNLYQDCVPLIFHLDPGLMKFIKGREFFFLRRALAAHSYYFFYEEAANYAPIPLVLGSKKYVDIPLSINFNEFEKSWTEVLSIEEEWTPEGICEEIYSALKKQVEPDNLSEKLVYNTAYSVGFVENFFTMYPNSRMLYLQRPLMDAAASIFGRYYFDKEKRAQEVKHWINYSAQEWRQEKILCKESQEKYPDRMLVVSFEKLIQNTKHEMQKVCDFLEIEFDEVMTKATYQGNPLEFDGENYVSQKFDSTENLLSREEINIVEEALKGKFSYRLFKGLIKEGLLPNYIVSKLKGRINEFTNKKLGLEVNRYRGNNP